MAQTKEELAAYQRKYYAEHREACRASSAKYHAANKEERAEYKRKWRAENKEEIAEYNRKYHAEHKEEIAAYAIAISRTTEGQARALVKSARSRAKKFGLEFSLTHPPIAEIIAKGTCQMTGLPFTTIHASEIKALKHSRKASIDRIDPFKGYTFDNIKVVICQYNMAKDQWTEAELVEFCENYLEHRKGK